MNRPLAFSLLVLALALPATTRAATFIDEFTGGANAGGWAFLQGYDTIQTTGGNPGAWLESPLLDTVDPAVYSAIDGGTPFTGDYRAANVMKLKIDFQTLHVDFGDGSEFNVVVLLRKTNGTPNDITDDDYAYFVGAATPVVGKGWVHYEFDVPSQSNDAVPAGWAGGSIDDCEHFRPGVTWTDIMHSVDQVEFHFLQPCYFAIFQQWQVGADNIAVETAGPTAVEPATWGGIKSAYR
jgi:hypothetical protein